MEAEFRVGATVHPALKACCPLKQLQVFVANCFCRNNWIQYSSDFSPTGTRYGECLRFASAGASWYEASQVCHTTAPGAYLADEFSKEKHKFNIDYARSVWNTRGQPNYFVGLSYESSLGGYAWQQSAGQPLVPVCCRYR